MRLAYGPDVPDALVVVVEHHARRIGLPLHLVERMAADLDTAEGFVVAAEQGMGLSFAMGVAYGAEAQPDADPVRATQPALEGLVRLRRRK